MCSSDCLTVTELAAVRRFLYAWREAAAESGFIDTSYQCVALSRPADYNIVKSLTRRSPAWYGRLDAICSAGDLDRLLVELDGSTLWERAA
jgi:hypothetical protein